MGHVCWHQWTRPQQNTQNLHKKGTPKSPRIATPWPWNCAFEGATVQPPGQWPTSTRPAVRGLKGSRRVKEVKARTTCGLPHLCTGRNPRHLNNGPPACLGTRLPTAMPGSHPPGLPAAASAGLCAHAQTHAALLRTPTHASAYEHARGGPCMRVRIRAGLCAEQDAGGGGGKAWARDTPKPTHRRCPLENRWGNSRVAGEIQVSAIPHQRIVPRGAPAHRTATDLLPASAWSDLKCRRDSAGFCEGSGEQGPGETDCTRAQPSAKT